MMDECLKQKVQLYKMIFAQMKQELKWKVSDTRTLMMAASMYVVNDRVFDIDKFKLICNVIKKQAGMFSPLKSEQRFSTAAMLDVRFDHPEEKVNDLLKLYDRLVEGGFGRGPFTYIAALVLLSNMPDDGLVEDSIQRALGVYKGMRSRHFFLTSSSDYPLAVLLAKREEPVDKLMDHIEHFYGELNANGFRKGNDLQMLSHILSIDHNVDNSELINRSVKVYDALKVTGIKPKSLHYPEIGLLSLLNDSSSEIRKIHEMMDDLTNDKLFKWHKDMNFTMAVNFLMSEKLVDKGLLETSICTTIEAIIQAQQAAMVAAIAGASAGSAGN